MLPSIILSTSPKPTDPSIDIWRDLRVSLWALETYVDPAVAIHICWDGPAAPTLVPDNANFNYHPRPEGHTKAQTLNWLVEKTAEPAFVLVNENTVLHPDTMSLLLEDVEGVQKIAGSKLGVMGTRSNDVVGPQNIRAANGGTLALNAMNYDSEDTVFQVNVVYPVAAWYSREAFNEIGGWIPEITELSDEIYSVEARARDWELYVSRAYVHHAPPSLAEMDAKRLRTSKDLLWMRKNRLDLYELFED